MKTKTIHGLEYTEAYRQGEILIFKLKDTKRKLHGASRIKSNVIRTGEKEGHQHKVEGDAQLDMLLESLAPTPGEKQEQASQGSIEVGDKGAQITHPEHGPIKLKKGKYLVQTQKEATGKNTSQSVED